MTRELCPCGMNIKCGFVVTRKDGTKFCSQDMNCEASNKWLTEHDSELLDKVMQKQRTIIDDDGVMYKVVFLKDIEDLKAEVEEC